MMLKKWLPWHFILKLAAKKFGFLDPVTLLARIRQFGQPSEVQEPIELLRAGVIFHARGVINTRAIQYNLDWIWPFWVTRQFSPTDASFIPRGFAFSHINATHRNWTAVGHPQLPIYPVVDPRGLLTPFHDSWSLDAWVMSADGNTLFPSKQKAAKQTLNLDLGGQVVTRTEHKGLNLECRAFVTLNDEHSAVLTLSVHAWILDQEGWLILSVRPCNPEGVQFVDKIAILDKEKGLNVNEADDILFESKAEKILFSTYEDGDVALNLNRAQGENRVDCPMGMATAAAFFPISQKEKKQLKITVPLDQETRWNLPEPVLLSADFKVPDEQFTFLFRAARHTLLMLTAKDVYPGPYTYRRFWFRDACFMINALLGLGLDRRSRRLIEDFPSRQTLTGYFLSQEGEWDSNGQVLWLANRYRRLTGEQLSESLLSALIKGARWILRKRRDKKDQKPHDGLLPAGFSAEHLGPNDYYYWDDFWAFAGLRAAAELAGESPKYHKDVSRFEHGAKSLLSRILESTKLSPGFKRCGAIPASPYRRMDAGAVGSLVADYPLQITEPGDSIMMNTAKYLMDNCFINNAFFQDMIHSGLNAYLTLGIAQTLLRNNDNRYRKLMRAVADIASSTGQWPEAINPITGGGCMGDGQHGWAAAEWIMMMRNLFIREENNVLIIGSGLLPEWLEKDTHLKFGPTLVEGGHLTVNLKKRGKNLSLYLKSDLKGSPRPCHLMVPGTRQKRIDTSVTEYHLTIK